MTMVTLVVIIIIIIIRVTTICCLVAVNICQTNNVPSTPCSSNIDDCAEDRDTPDLAWQRRDIGLGRVIADIKITKHVCKEEEEKKAYS